MKCFYIATLCLAVSSSITITIPPLAHTNNPPPFIDPRSYGSYDSYGSPPFIDPRSYNSDKNLAPDEVLLNVTDVNGANRSIRTNLSTPIYILKNQLAYSTTLLHSLGTSDQIELSINGYPLDDNQTVGSYVTQPTMDKVTFTLIGKNGPIFLIKEGQDVPKPMIGIGLGQKK